MTVQTIGGRAVRTIPMGLAQRPATTHAMTILIEDGPDSDVLNTAVRATLLAFGAIYDTALYTSPDGANALTCHEVSVVTGVSPDRVQRHLRALHSAGYLEQRLLPLGGAEASQIAYVPPSMLRVPADRKDQP